MTEKMSEASWGVKNMNSLDLLNFPLGKFVLFHLEKRFSSSIIMSHWKKLGLKDFQASQEKC